MKRKLRGWKTGVLFKTLTSVGGSVINKGEIVQYRRVKTVPDSEGYKLTDFEWWYNTDNCLIRTTERTIEGQEYVKEPYRNLLDKNGCKHLIPNN